MPDPQAFQKINPNRRGIPSQGMSHARPANPNRRGDSLGLDLNLPVANQSRIGGSPPD